MQTTNSNEVNNRLKRVEQYFKKVSGSTAEDIHKIMHEDYNRAIKRAELMASIDRKSYDQPYVLLIPFQKENGRKVSYRLDLLANGAQTLLYDQTLISVLFFAENTFYYYQSHIDHQTGEISMDLSGEFDYFDVVHIVTRLGYDDPQKPKYETLDLEIGLSDGAVVPIHLRSYRLQSDYKPEIFISEDELKIINRLKKNVRESRQG
ncbi:MAG: hypothetical protein V3569_00825 [Acholeplasmataceae bacterium]|nr:hypothetical protein [Acholeplasmataceae bacterium]